MSKRRVFNPKAKADIVLELMAKKKSYEEASREYGVSVERLEEWMQIFIENGTQIFRDEDDDQREIAKLERQIAQLTMEHEILSKAKKMLLEERGESDI